MFINDIKTLMNGQHRVISIFNETSIYNTLNKFTESDFTKLSLKVKFSDEFINKYHDKFNWNAISASQYLSHDIIKKFESLINWNAFSAKKHDTIVIKCYKDKLNLYTVLKYNPVVGSKLVTETIDLNHDIVTVNNIKSLHYSIANLSFTREFILKVLELYDEQTLDNYILPHLVVNPKHTHSHDLLKPHVVKALNNPSYNKDGYLLITSKVFSTYSEDEIKTIFTTYKFKDIIHKLDILRNRLFSDDFLEFLLNQYQLPSFRIPIYEIINITQLPSESFILKHIKYLNIQRIIARRYAYNKTFSPEFYNEIQNNLIVNNNFDTLHQYAFQNNVPPVVKQLLNAQKRPPTIMATLDNYSDNHQDINHQGINTTIYTPENVQILSYDINQDADLVGPNIYNTIIPDIYSKYINV